MKKILRFKNSEKDSKKFNLYRKIRSKSPKKSIKITKNKQIVEKFKKTAIINRKKSIFIEKFIQKLNKIWKNLTDFKENRTNSRRFWKISGKNLKRMTKFQSSATEIVKNLFKFRSKGKSVNSIKITQTTLKSKKEHQKCEPIKK